MGQHGHGTCEGSRGQKFPLPWGRMAMVDGRALGAEISAPMGQGGHGTWESSIGQKFPLPWGSMVMGHGRALGGRNIRSHGAGWPWDMGEFYRAEFSAPMGQHGLWTWEGSGWQKFPLPWDSMAMEHGRALEGRIFRFHGAAWPWDIGGLWRAEISAPMGQHGHGTWEGSRGQKFPLPWGRMVKGHGRTLEGKTSAPMGQDG